MAVTTDVLVLGSGIAGLSFALEVAEHAEVTVVSKRGADQGSTGWAQGGIAAVLSSDDAFEKHVEDTHAAGAGLCHDVVVNLCVRDAPSAIRWLLDLGVEFSKRSDGALDLGREGGHSERRIAHAGDITGAQVERVLLECARAHRNIRLLEWNMGVDLITMSKFGGPDRCVGAYVLDEATGRVEQLLAKATVLATGGAGKVYLYTSNPDVSTGDGVAMAFRAGAEVANMEFYQFHPTVLYEPRAKSFLISEALRGEGAHLCLPSGEPFMKRHHPMADLAPRDVVARAIDFEMKRTGSDFVLLDITNRSQEFLLERFPTILAECARFGVDIATQPIPVVPAAHFMCGGVTSDLHGRTTLPGLFAIGEVSCTGLHGANRLASNSLLEGLVFGRRAASKVRDILSESGGEVLPPVPDWEVGDAQPSEEEVVVAHSWDEVRRLMWNYVGIVRSDTRLRRAARRIAVLEEEIREYYWRHVVTRDLLELRNIQTVAELIIASAASRRESRGLHFTSDYPDLLSRYARDTVVKRGVIPHLRGA
ncbi:MAG TPA: L-aspartate oxidase [Polyangiaceae bacterium]